MTKHKKGITHYKNSPCERGVLEMLQHSNWIENELSNQAMDDAITAWKYAVRNSDNITTKYVLKIHEFMQRNLRPDIAGKFRQCDVYIGGECRPYISDALILAKVKEAVGLVLNSKIDKMLPKKHREQIAKAAHVQFEKAHPFQDGNGRVGRILYNIHRLKLNLDIHIIHEGDEQMSYYQWFKE